MNIGCIVLQNIDNQHYFVGINCAKGRGIILPGGKYEPEKDVDFHHCASRELKEETGILVGPADLRYIWHGPDGNSYITYAFKSLRPARRSALSDFSSEEGPLVIASWPILLRSSFAGYYRILKEVMER